MVGYLQKGVCSALGLCLHYLESNWPPVYEKQQNKCLKTVCVIQHCRHLRWKTAHLHIFTNTGQELFILIWTDDLPSVEAHLKLAFDGRIPVVLHRIVRPGNKYHSMSPSEDTRLPFHNHVCLFKLGPEPGMEKIYLPGSSLAISAQRFPSMQWAL